MIFMDAIHVHVEKGKKQDKVGGNNTLKIDDSL
jgi:hypothetical protein